MDDQKLLYRTQLTTTAAPWLPQTLYGPGAAFYCLNAIRIITFEAKVPGVSGGGTNPDGTFWGTPFTQWCLDNAEMGTTLKDGGITWTVVSVASMDTPPPILKENAYGGTASWTQSTAVGGTPVAFFNYIPPDYFEPIIYRNWDRFENFWNEKIRYTTRLYSVQIVFNNEILLAGTGNVNAFMPVGPPQFHPFYGPEFKEVKKEIAALADRLGIQPVTMRNARLQLPNMVYVFNPDMPKPGQSYGAGRERGGKFSNL